MGFRLYKSEKLCSAVAIEHLFSRDAANATVSAFPVRALWRSNPTRKWGAPLQFMISVPKKRLRHAVDRVKMRRRIREAYRLIHSRYPLAEGARYDVVFLYVDSALNPYHRIERSMERMLDTIARHSHTAQAQTPESPTEPSDSTPHHPDNGETADA